MISVYRDWILAARPWSFTMTAISVSVGGALAALDDAFSWPLYLLTLIGTILMHAASNLINDYDDVRHGVDDPKVPTARYRPHPLMEGRLTPGRSGSRPMRSTSSPPPSASSSQPRGGWPCCGWGSPARLRGSATRRPH